MTSGRWQLGPRLAFAAVAYAFAVTMLGTTLPTPLYGLYQAQFGFSQLMVTVIFATYAAGVIVALLLFGRLSDQVGRRNVLLPALGFSALSAVTFLLAHDIAPLFLGRVLSGLSAGIFTGTATATLLDLAPDGGRDRATLVGTIMNMGGLGLGPLLAGILAQWATSPLHLPFWVDLVLLIPAVIGIWLIPEPVKDRTRPSLKFQVPGVPADIRPTFIRSSLAAFAGFAVLGLFTAVAPAFLGKILGVTNLAGIGLVVFSIFAASAAGQISLNWIDKEVALPVGCYGLIVGMALLATSLAVSSTALLVVGGLVAGLGQGLSFRAGLTTVNEQSPPDRRAEVASAFFVIAYVAISIPVVGVGLLAHASTLETAGLVFAGVVAVIAAVVIVLLHFDRDD